MAKAFDFDRILYQLWYDTSLKTAELLGADRANIFLLDAVNYQIVSLIPSLEFEVFQEHCREVGGVFKEAINLKKSVNIGLDFYDDFRSEGVKKEEAKTGYRTYTLLTMPVLNFYGEVIGLVEVVNKLKTKIFNESLFPNIDPSGFTKEDEKLLTEFLPILVPIVEKSLENFYRKNNLIKSNEMENEVRPPSRDLWLNWNHQDEGENTSEMDVPEQENEIQDALSLLDSVRSEEKKNILDEEKESDEKSRFLLLLSAIRKISERSFNLDETLQTIMTEAKNLTNSDRSMVWIVDREKNELWTKISLAGSFQEIRIPMGAGFAGRVAQTGEPMVMEFDFYDHPDSEVAKQADQRTGYRTCSLLCLPIFNSKGLLVGVTHLVNKLRFGDFPAYDPDTWPVAPEAWKASFSLTDREIIEAFNLQAGIVLENAEILANLTHQEKLKNDVFRCCGLGLIATNLTGHILAINPKAKELMGFSHADWLEGRVITDLVNMEDGDLSEYINRDLTTNESRKRPQKYGEKLLIDAEKQSKKINLIVQYMGENSDDSNGILLILEEIYPEDNSSILYLKESKNEKELPKKSNVKPIVSRKEISVLYSGIRSFTPLLENLEDGSVSELLKEYFNSMSEAVIKYQGTIDKYVGDAIIATFSSSIGQGEHGWCAVQTAIEMRQRLVELNVRRVEDGKPALRMGIGINSDSFTGANLNTPGRLEIAPVSDSLNMGFYLEKASKQYGCDIVISDSTHRLCCERVWARELDNIRVKGQHEAMPIYQLVALRSEELPEEKVQVIEYYSQGRSYYRNREFSLAAEQFSKVLEISSWDIPAAIQLERCQHWLNSPPPADWDGVWKLTEI